MARRYLSKKAKQAIHSNVWATCQVILRFDGPKIVAIDLAKHSKDTMGTDQQQIENSVLKDPLRLAVNIVSAVSCNRVVRKLSAFQILPPPWWGTGEYGGPGAAAVVNVSHARSEAGARLHRSMVA